MYTTSQMRPTTAAARKTYEVLQRIHVHGQGICQMLVVHSNLEVVMPLHHAIQGLQTASHELQEGRLPAAIEADNGHSSIQIDAQVYLHCAIPCEQTFTWSIKLSQHEQA